MFKISGGSFFLFEDIDKATLRVGDTVDILIGSSNVVAPNGSGATVNSISGKEVSLGNILDLLQYRLKHTVLKKSVGSKFSNSNQRRK